MTAAVFFIVTLIVLIPLVAIVLDSRLGQALAERVEGRRLSAGDEVTGERIAFLEGEVDRLSGEIERLTEETGFIQKLLSDRTTASDEEERRLAGGGEDG